MLTILSYTYFYQSEKARRDSEGKITNKLKRDTTFQHQNTDKIKKYKANLKGGIHVMGQSNSTKEGLLISPSVNIKKLQKPEPKIKFNKSPQIYEISK